MFAIERVAVKGLNPQQPDAPVRCHHAYFAVPSNSYQVGLEFRWRRVPYAKSTET